MKIPGFFNIHKEIKIITSVVFIFFSVVSCDKDKSDSSDILDFSVIALSSSSITSEGTYIDNEKSKIYIFLNNDLNSQTFPISVTTDIKLSSGATLASGKNNEISFSSPDEVKTLEVKAEDGTIKNWYLHLIHQQIQNSGFEKWYTNKGMNGLPYQEIGAAAETSVWSTANMGTSMYSVYGSQPLQEGDNTIVEIKTGKTSVVPITAATLFIGTFDLSGAVANPTDPKQATSFGMPFIFRPKALKVKYKYTAGENYIQATPNSSSIFGGFAVENIAGEDQCTIYAILEASNMDTIEEIGRATFTSGTTADAMSEISIGFEYTSNTTPTHITIVFSSSKDGDLWRGAIGSTLTVDDLELIYE